MLRSAKEIEAYGVGATDGVVGQVADFYFDDEAWVIRYLVVDTGGWLSSRRVLVSPIAVGTPNRENKLLPASISREQVEKSPDIDTEQPVSRQHERMFSDYYAYPYYWGGAGYWAAGMYPTMMAPGYSGLGGMGAGPRVPLDRVQAEQENPHLRSINAVVGYHIHARDGDIGHVSGMLFDERTWAIRYLIVNTSNWWLGHQVLVAPQWIKDVSWFDRTVTVSIARQAVKDAPVYDPKALPDQPDEARLYEHYGQIDDWSNHPMRQDELSQL